MASKLNEVFPLRMKTLYEKVVHKKVSVVELRDREADFLKLFGYCLADNNIYETTKIALAMLRAGTLLRLSQIASSTRSTWTKSSTSQSTSSRWRCLSMPCTLNTRS